MHTEPTISAAAAPATLLVVEASPRGEQSVSRALTARFVAEWRSHRPQGRVLHRDLSRTALGFLTMPWLDAYFTPAAQHTDAMRQQLALSDELVAEILQTDHIAIGTPVHNYNVPANLKAYIDHVVCKGITLGMTGEGLVHGKKCTLLMASGGAYTEGSPIRDRDLATAYLRLILKVIGIEDVTVVAGGHAKAVDMGQISREAFVAGFAPERQRRWRPENSRCTQHRAHRLPLVTHACRTCRLRAPPLRRCTAE